MCMNRSRLLALLLLLVGTWVAVSGAVLAADGEGDLLSLDEAFRLAREGSPKIRLARWELEDARLALEQIRSTALMRPDPVALLQAESGYELAGRNLALVENTVRLEVAESFLGVLRVQNLMDVVEGSLALAERQHAIAENRFAVGSAARVEIIRAANQVSGARANLLEMEGKRELALMAFRMGLGLGLTDEVHPDPQLTPLTDIEVNLEDDLRFALDNRLEVLRARSAVDVARKQVELSTNSYTPAIALARAEVGLRRAEEALQQVITGIELEVRQLHQALIDHQRRLEVLEQAIVEAEETLAITEEMYAAGVATDVEVLGAQTALTQSKTDYVNTMFDLRTAQVRYLHATARAFADGSGNGQ